MFNRKRSLWVLNLNLKMQLWWCRDKKKKGPYYNPTSILSGFSSISYQIITHSKAFKSNTHVLKQGSPDISCVLIITCRQRQMTKREILDLLRMWSCKIHMHVLDGFQGVARQLLKCSECFLEWWTEVAIVFSSLLWCVSEWNASWTRKNVGW